ncbi:MAG TPA: hypothetical protein VK879_14930 [Candidatus Sulfomarinibacteraceae bacterium]|nr:hypothetical protein [Candidatus Sulfomarinibacteraceae bacterium]
MKRKCTARTNAGRPCRAWAVRGSEPPRCPAHAGLTGGASSSRRSDAGSGFYGRQLTTQEISDLVASTGDSSLVDEIAVSRVVLRRLLSVLQDEDELSVRELTRVASMVFNGSRVVAHLLRDERALSGEAADGIAGAIGHALDELATEWGLEL